LIVRITNTSIFLNIIAVTRWDDSFWLSFGTS